MKPILSAFFLCTIIATPAAAQDYYGSPRAPGPTTATTVTTGWSHRCLFRAIQFLRPKAS